MASNYSTAAFLPLAGFTPAPNELVAKPGSMISGQNAWVRQDMLEPRWRLSAQTIANLKSTGGEAFSLDAAAAPQSGGQRVVGIIGFNNPIDGTSGAVTPNGLLWVSGNTGQLAISLYAPSTSQVTWWGLSLGTDASYGTMTSPTAISVHTDANWRGAGVYYATVDVNLLVLAAGCFVWFGTGPGLVALCVSLTAVGVAAELDRRRT